MREDIYSTAPNGTAARRGLSLRTVLMAAALAFLGGAALVGYLVWDGRLAMSERDLAAMMGETPSKPASSAPAVAPSPQAVASAPAAPVGAVAASGVDSRVAALEQRLARLDLQAAAAEGNAARAEGLLVALATRRALERGAPLGYLSDQLKLRFGAAQPVAVETIIRSAATPVTLDQLVGGLDAMAARLTEAPVNEGGWQRLRRELSGLFVVRHDDTPSTNPMTRLDLARLLLRTGQVDGAIDAVSRLPGAAAAGDWIVQARRYAEAERALDLIETTALLDPDRLRTASGQSVRQPSPAGPSPAAGPVANASEQSF
ncbi:hypothetical protein B0I00_2024 [Novosphingobium kunmingense]|uniref:Inner membrane protein n=2 Tax=Novosphingobium kunmingense TaxID=1211806 RepID=A0A2N0H695_9SPHN|nr:hypothetical protein B0I00_2024 [Novosphingobium kunmingense]